MDDCRKRQTSTATPAEPGDLPWGLAILTHEKVRVGGKVIEVAKVKITDAGRRVI